MPIVFAFVLAFAFLLLLVSFRSIVIPLKAILMNLLSVAAAYGVVVAIFQWGWGENLLDFNSNGGVASWLPMFLFVILFGLSMDYHVFILSRVREYYDRGLSTEDAVAQGIKSTAGVVTSAAVVMVLVFGVFSLMPIIDMKEMGIGLAAAILIDATIVRAVLLPATMKLLGKWNWYLPRGSSGCRTSSTSARSSRRRSRPPPSVAHESARSPCRRPGAFTFAGRAAGARACSRVSGSRRSPTRPPAPVCSCSTCCDGLESREKRARGELAHLLPRCPAHGVIGGDDAHELGLRFSAARRSRRSSACAREPHGERPDRALLPHAVEDHDAARAPTGDEARERVDELVAIRRTSPAWSRL